MNSFKRLCYGILARIVSPFIPVEKKNWIFGADYGNNYREGTKYLIEYMRANHPDYKCTFVTQNQDVIDMLKKKGIECVQNLSLKGLVRVAKAEKVFTTQYMNDILYAFKKNGREYHYILHGMPYKLAADALPNKIIVKQSLADRIRGWLADTFMVGYKIEDVSFFSVTSDFLVEYELKDHSGKVPVKVLGMPRNDALFDHSRMLNEKWIDDTEGKFIITYMPTHRAYGVGEASPSPFINRLEIQQWLRENNILLLVKNHPNMISKLEGVKNTDVIRDITKDRLDPQVCIYHSDALITDYSSVWMDYLLLCRPIIFYHYDNWESNDAGVHYDIKNDKIGHYCYDEDTLFELIKNIKQNYDTMKPSLDVVHKYHKYIDGNSCERYFNEIEGK